MCEKLGGMTVDEMLEKMTSIELTRWQAYYSLEFKERENAKSQAKLKANTRAMSRRRF